MQDLFDGSSILMSAIQDPTSWHNDLPGKIPFPSDIVDMCVMDDDLLVACEDGEVYSLNETVKNQK